MVHARKPTRVAVRVVVESAVSPTSHAQSGRTSLPSSPSRTNAGCSVTSASTRPIRRRARTSSPRHWRGWCRRSSTRWCGAWNRSRPCIPAARRGTGGVLAGASGHRSAGSSRWPAPARTYSDQVRQGHESRRAHKYRSSRTAWPRTASVTRACQAGSSPRRRNSSGRRGCLRQRTTCDFRPRRVSAPSRYGCSTGIGRSWSPVPDRQVGVRLGEVTHLVRPMSSLFAPRVVLRVLVAAMGRRMKAMGRKASSDGLRSMPPGAA